MPLSIDGDALLTLERATFLASVTRRTLYNWINAKKVQCVRTAGGSIRIVAASLFRDAAEPK